MPLSYVDYPADGLEDEFDFSALDLFDDIPKKDQIKVFVSGQIQAYGTDYTVVGSEVKFEAGSIPADETTVRVSRDTQISTRLVNFTNSSILTAADLNKNTDQLLFLSQELDDTVANLALTTAGSIADGAITESKLRQSPNEEAVVTGAIRDGAVTEDKLAANAVTETKIDNGSITLAKMTADSVDTSQLVNLAVSTAKIDDLAVTTGKIDNLAVTAAKIANNTITTTQLDSSVPYIKNQGSNIGAIHGGNLGNGVGVNLASLGGTAAQTWFVYQNIYTGNAVYSVGRAGFYSGNVIVPGTTNYETAYFAIRVS
jgi:hypothetical protein